MMISFFVKSQQDNTLKNIWFIELGFRQVNFYALLEFIRSKFNDILGSLSYMLSIAEDVLLLSFRGAFDLPNNDIYCLISALGMD